MLYFRIVAHTLCHALVFCLGLCLTAAAAAPPPPTTLEPTPFEEVHLSLPTQAPKARASKRASSTPKRKAAPTQTAPTLPSPAEVVASVKAQEAAQFESLPPAQQMQWLQEHVHQNDLNFLWQAVVQQNHVLRFALQKLALPVEAHNGHSSQFLRKSLGVLVSGAGLGASLLLPTGGYQNLGIATGSQALQNIIQGRNKPMSDLSPTEHIQLATLVDELKFQLISQYETYTQALGQWQQAQHQLQSQTVLYHGVKGQGGLVAMSAASGFYRAVAEEQRHKQQAQLARLQLERLAGTEAVAELKLTPAVALLLHPPVSPPAASPLSPSSSPLQDEPLQSSGSLLVAPPAPHRKGQTVQRWAVGQQAKALKKSPLPTTAKQMPLPQLRYERDEWL